MAFSDVIVKNITMLSSASPATYNEVHEAVKSLADENGWTRPEAAAVIAQSYGLKVEFTDASRLRTQAEARFG